MTLGCSKHVTLGCCLFLVLLASAINISSAQTTVAVSAGVPAGTSCASNRTRKAWEAYNETEKTLYVAAVADAISRGYQQKFVELHTEYWSEAEAHRTCVFIYWHRMYLLGYENMLRSLKPEYACLTLPVWDHLSLSANNAAGSCSTLQACSPILTALGGISTWKSTSNIIYNVTIPYSTSSTSGARCVTATPLSGFCGNSTTCAKCIVRGTVTKTYPSDALFGSVYQQLFTSNTWVDVSNQTERGVHGTLRAHK
jgi:tyrosinase